MDTEAMLLPEPFSEKNIDGSPISKASEGRGLFRNSGSEKRRAPENRGSRERQALPVSSRQDSIFSPQSTEARSRSYDEDVFRKNDSPVHTAVPVHTPAPEPVPVPAPEYDTERFDPPVDEKPGMIPNPMKMPPAKKKSSLEYDLDDSDYGSYDAGSAAVSQSGATVSDEDDGYGYDLDADSFGGDDYGYGDDFPKADSSRDDDMDFGYGGSEGTGTGSADIGTDDDYDADYGSAGGYDSDYDTDYGSGSDMSDDYY